MMQSPHCVLVCHSSSQHLQQLYAGFGLLAAKDSIRAEVRRAADYTGSRLGRPVLSVILNDRLRITYDTADSEALMEDELASSDFYFKRSYSPAVVSRRPDSRKIFPLGFSYPVYGPNDFTLQRLYWAVGTSDFLPLLVRDSRLWSRLFRVRSGRAYCRIADLEGSPRLDQDPRILFITRVWPPEGEVTPPLDRAERYAMNEMRIQCVRRLRAEFGSRFVGGLQPSKYALRTYPDYIIENPRLTEKRRYIDLVRSSSICISTVGLQKSNPWKIAEYIAGSKAIVSERLNHEVPGYFTKGKNYLEFANPEQCIEMVARLVQNPDLRLRMMKANEAYYRKYLRPDALVLNTLNTILRSASRSDRPGKRRIGRSPAHPHPST